MPGSALRRRVRARPDPRSGLRGAAAVRARAGVRGGSAVVHGGVGGAGAAGHTGFTGTSLVVDPVTDTFVVLLANAVHPRRRAPDSRPRASAGTRVARAVRG
ncbi:serine hydrolase [Streptomyces sp. Marseille-Q5077]|uniref:serine hydrolase n=1 Tax=Streptomyces sp. Marseille-Q5077 TaxID=3418995 RepID=UPI003CFF6F03